MKAKLKLILLLIIPLLFLTGCMKEYKLSEENSNIIAEYMAGTLLKYDKNYEGKLTPLEELKEELDKDESKEEVTKETNEEIKKEIKEDTNKKGTNEYKKEVVKSNNELLTDFMDIENIEFEIKDYKFQDDFLLKNNNRAYAALQPKNDCKLLIITFKITNNGEKKKNINLLSKKLTYKLETSDKEYNPLITLFQEDMFSMITEFKNNESKKGLLFFEVDENIEMDDILLRIIKDKEMLELVLGKN